MNSHRSSSNAGSVYLDDPTRAVRFRTYVENLGGIEDTIGGNETKIRLLAAATCWLMKVVCTIITSDEDDTYIERTQALRKGVQRLHVILC